MKQRKREKMKERDGGREREMGVEVGRERVIKRVINGKRE